MALLVKPVIETVPDRMAVPRSKTMPYEKPWMLMVFTLNNPGLLAEMAWVLVAVGVVVVRVRLRSVMPLTPGAGLSK